MKTAYLAGGCFWCITPIFKIYDGVGRVVSGYSGGDEDHPRYEDVKAQRTGHRETLSVEYDPEQIDYSFLLEIFLANIDPYDGEGQFIDRGHSYTPAIYWCDAEQKAAAAKALAAWEAEHGEGVKVALEPFKSFWEAEEYHQDYYLKNPEAFERELIESGRKKE